LQRPFLFDGLTKLVTGSVHHALAILEIAIAGGLKWVFYQLCGVAGDKASKNTPLPSSHFLENCLASSNTADIAATIDQSTHLKPQHDFCCL
jgi:hypothetical protein